MPFDFAAGIQYDLVWSMTTISILMTQKFFIAFPLTMLQDWQNINTGTHIQSTSRLYHFCMWIDWLRMKYHIPFWEARNKPAEKRWRIRTRRQWIIDAGTQEVRIWTEFQYTYPLRCLVQRHSFESHGCYFSELKLRAFGGFPLHNSDCCVYITCSLFLPRFFFSQLVVTSSNSIMEWIIYIIRQCRQVFFFFVFKFFFSVRFVYLFHCSVEAIGNYTNVVIGIRWIVSTKMRRVYVLFVNWRASVNYE